MRDGFRGKFIEFSASVEFIDRFMFEFALPLLVFVSVFCVE